MSGYLRKKQKNGAKWKRLWFVLRDGILYAFKAPEDLLPADTISIMGYKLEILSEVRFCQLFCINLILRLVNVQSLSSFYVLKFSKSLFFKQIFITIFTASNRYWLIYTKAKTILIESILSCNDTSLLKVLKGNFFQKRSFQKSKCGLFCQLIWQFLKEFVETNSLLEMLSKWKKRKKNLLTIPFFEIVWKVDKKCFSQTNTCDKVNLQES